MPIKKDQIYADCDPRSCTTIRIVGYLPGANRADVVDAVTGKRPRSILVASLHESATTETGKPRRRGYALINGDPR